MLGQKEITKEQAREGWWKEQMVLLAEEKDLACMWLHAKTGESWPKGHRPFGVLLQT